MKILIRTDSSTEIGTGHVMRCVTLAHRLRKNAVAIGFVCRDLPGNICDLIETEGFVVHRLPRPDGDSRSALSDWPVPYAHWLGLDWRQDAEQTVALLKKDKTNSDLLVVDHYALDGRWESSVRCDIGRIMAIDDLADRSHDCDLLLDQNLYSIPDARYQSLVPAGCRILVGPKYALLRPGFTAARKKLRVRDGHVKRILIFMGGSDVTNETGKALQAIGLLNRPDIGLDVVVGRTNPHHEAIKMLCAPLSNYTLHPHVRDIETLMTSADLAVGAAGSTTWERCFLGLPSLMVVTAANQHGIAQAVASAGSARNLGWHQFVTPARIAEAIQQMLSNPAELKQMSAECLRLMEAGSMAEGEQELMDAMMDAKYV
jgi:UDP-2,4-diacetamido-2,4,6-trideoxy-beta-L-altropyranose hydrolase